MASSTRTMRAVVMVRRGPSKDSLEVHTDWPVPELKPGQVLVEVAATSVNAGEWKLRSGFAPIPLKLPKILGEDISGVVVQAPPGSKFKVGDRVFGGTGQALKSGDRFGTYAEFVAADEVTLALMPPSMSFQDGGALGIAGGTAWQGLAPSMPLKGKRVLVHGGAGGVASCAIQIAKAQGAHVTTTCSGRNLGFVTKELGADEAIDYTAGPWYESPQAKAAPFDLILDIIGGPSYEDTSMQLLAKGGRLAVFGASGPGVERVSMAGIVAMLAKAGWRTLKGKMGLGLRYNFVMYKSEASKGMEQIAALMEEGKFKVHFDRVMRLEEMVAAHEYAEQGHVRGKLGIIVKQM